MAAFPYANQCEHGCGSPRQTRRISRQALFRHYVDGRRPGCCRSELDARDDGTIANAVAPVRFPRARQAPRSPRYRAHTARRPHKVSARPASAPPPHAEKNQGEKMVPGRFLPALRARPRAIPTLFFSTTPLDGIFGMFAHVCAVRVSHVRVLAARGARSLDRPPSRFLTPRGELFGKRLVGFFREIPGDGRAGCSTRARAHFDPGFFRMKPPWVLRTTVRFLAYYTRHSRVRCGANDHPS